MRASLALVAAALASCTPSKPAPVDDPGVKAVTSALDKRFGAITDFVITGTAEQGSEKLPFSYAMKQPEFVRATLGDNAITFDGKALLVVDNAKKTAQRQDLATVDDATKLMMLHQAFSRFTCEGWRPPLLRPSGFSVALTGAQWIITVPIDDATLKEQRLVLKSPGAEFVEKSILDKTGKAVTSTKVTASLTDPGTKLELPAAWETADSEGNTLKIHVDKAVVNGGAAGIDFGATLPAGYKAP